MSDVSGQRQRRMPEVPPSPRLRRGRQRAEDGEQKSRLRARLRRGKQKSEDGGHTSEGSGFPRAAISGSNRRRIRGCSGMLKAESDRPGTGVQCRRIPREGRLLWWRTTRMRTESSTIRKRKWNGNRGRLARRISRVRILNDSGRCAAFSTTKQNSR
jgi:hypothetical protein